MKRYPIDRDNETYIITLLINGVMVNVFFDDAGQQYYLQYYEPETDEIVETGCGAYNTNYEDEALYLFESPEECPYYTEVHSRCEEMAQPYCCTCPCFYLLQNREERAGNKEKG